MSAKGNCTKEADGTIIHKAVSKTGSAPAELDSSKWYTDKCEIAGYRSEHLFIKINQDGIIRVDGNYNDGKASRSFFNEYIIPDGVDYEALEFRIYEADQNTLVIVGAIGSQGGEIVQTSAKQVVAQQDNIKRTEDVRISSTFTETFESTELEGSEDMSREVRVVDNKFEAKVNVSEYKSEEVHVKISKKVVLIYTSRKEVTSTRNEIKKTFEIPAGVKPESIASVVGKDGNLIVSAPVDKELVRQQKLQETTKKSMTTISNTTNEVLIRIRTVNTTKNVTGQDLKDVKIVNDRFEMNVDLREYAENEITVEICKGRRVITISANHKTQFESCSTYREFTLPDGAPDSNPNAIDAALSQNGILTISGPCTPLTQPAALTEITDDITNKMLKQQQQNTTVQQQQNTSVQQHRKNSSVQQVQDTSVLSEQQIVQKSRYSKITRETFTLSTMTSLDITDAFDSDEPLVKQPDTPIEDVTTDMVVDEDGNYATEVNIKDYRPEEITIKASKSVITIIGRKNEENREFVKTIRVPIDVVVTPDKIRSIIDKSTRVLTIIIKRNTSVTATTTKQITDKTAEDRTNEQKRIDSLQQQRQVQQKQESIEETQTKIQTQQVNQQKQVHKRETFTSSTTTSLDITDAFDSDEPLVKQPDTPIEDVTTEMVVDEDGNYVTEVNIKDYRPEEITIKASKSVITIIGRKNEENREFVKTIRVPIDVVVTPDKIRSIIDKSTRVLTIIIKRNTSVTTTTTKQITDKTAEDQTNEQKRIDSLQQQIQQQRQVQQKQESIEETQTKIQTQQVNQQNQVHKRETFTSSTTTSLDITDACDSDEPLVTQPDTPIEDVTTDMVVDEDGNYATEVNIKDYRPEEITIKASKSVITIIGRKNEENREFVKMIRVPIDVVVTPDKIRSIIDKSTRVLTIIIKRNTSVTTTTTKQNTDNTAEDQTNEQKRIDSLQQQKHQQRQVQQKQESIEETQTKIQTQQVNQQKQVHKRETFTSSTTTSLDITDACDSDEPLVTQPDTPIEDVTTDMVVDEDGNYATEVNIKDYRPEEITIKASKSVITIIGRKNEENREFVKTIRVPIDVVVTPDKIRSIIDKSTRVLTIIIKRNTSVTTTTTKQITDKTAENQTNEQNRIDSLQDQRQQNTTNTTTTSKRTIKTTTTSVESLQKLGYNFDSATSQLYTGDPKFFERATTVVDYKPEELEIKIAMPWIVIEGKQEMSAENGWRSKQFTKMFTVPEGVRPENVRLELNDAGDVVNCTAQIG